MSAGDWLAEQFEDRRRHLTAVAYRMLGSASDAEDAVQETWLKLSRADVSGVANLGGWLTTVTARVCLDMLRSRRAKREDHVAPDAPPLADRPAREPDPADEAALADSVGLALLVVLEALSPAERVAFVLHDLFDVSFAEIGPIVGRSEDAAKQLASRARRRVRGADLPAASDQARRREVVDAFLAAARGGDFERLVSLLDDEVTLHADATAMRGRRTLDLRGAATVAKLFSGRAEAARTALLDDEVGIVVAPLGRLLMVIRVRIAGGRIAALEAIGDPERLRALRIAAPEPGR